jgi:hypothetical protein
MPKNSAVINPKLFLKWQKNICQYKASFTIILKYPHAQCLFYKFTVMPKRMGNMVLFCMA